MHGANGQGKSNLLEAIYVLAVAKSPRASSDRELVRHDVTRGEDTYSRVAAQIEDDGQQLSVQIDFKSTLPNPQAGSDSEGQLSLGGVPQGRLTQKYIRVNGVPRKASDLVGQIKAVMFSADDLELVYGPPSVRRRYLDILISQLDRRYLRALQRYQRVIYQRNHLLRTLRDQGAQRTDLDFWDNELVEQGKYIMAQRVLTSSRLSDLVLPIHQSLTGGSETLEMYYRPSAGVGDENSEDSMAQDLRTAIDSRRQREIAQGVTLSGPHRDDLEILIDGLDAGAYASRGQSKTAALSMRLAEARHLKAQRQQEPILLLDDVLSELDVTRRAHVLENASLSQQCFITTVGIEAPDVRFLPRVNSLAVSRGHVEVSEISSALV